MVLLFMPFDFSRGTGKDREFRWSGSCKGSKFEIIRVRMILFKILLISIQCNTFFFFFRNFVSRSFNIQQDSDLFLSKYPNFPTLSRLFYQIQHKKNRIKILPII